MHFTNESMQLDVKLFVTAETYKSFMFRSPRCAGGGDMGADYYS